jgi:4-amino-4-deoxy-L-arabinose transferase-like glycosyltransferase
MTHERLGRFRRPVVLLLILLVADVLYRAHTFGPRVRLRNEPSAAEPLDCDEAAYAYIGHRLLQGDVMYRDLTENKPPLGYWLYAGGVAAGGYTEQGVRVLPIPFVLGTIVLLFRLGERLAGLPAACLGAGVYVVLSTDPYLFGNGSNMEHFMNFFSVASLALVVRGRDGRRWALLTAGLCLGAATLVKQVAILPVIVYLAALARGRGRVEGDPPRPLAARLGDGLALLVGLALILAVAGAVLVVQGAGASAYEDVLHYGRALATDTLPEPHQPSALIRWLTGNADPNGRLPWPFGSTNYLVWWGTGSWPLWLAAVPCAAMLLLGPGAATDDRLVAGWTVAAALQVILPGLYWQHYYLLPTPGVSLAVAAVLARALGGLIAGARGKGRGAWILVGNLLVALTLSAAIVATVVIQVRSYLLVAPRELTVRYKGGAQWVVLRDLGGELARRCSDWPDRKLYIWGWQSPLHFYGRLDSPTRHFFVDNLLRDQADRDHPLIRPRIEEIMATLRRRPPGLIFAGYPPFPALAAFLRERYMPSRLVPSAGGLGLWVERSRYAEFEGFPAGGPGGLSREGPAR